MLRHFIQRLARELAAFLLRFGIGVVRRPVEIAGDLPAKGGLHAAHIGFINVDAIADKVVFLTTNSTGRI